MITRPKTKKSAAGSRSTKPVLTGTRKQLEAGSALRLERIMVPVDFSEGSRKAVAYAVSLALDYDATVALIHVVEKRLADRPLLTRAKRELKTLADEAVQHQVTVNTLLKIGDPIEQIIREANVERIDLLLISTHSRADAPAPGLGSAAEQVVRNAPCPVLVVREMEHDFLRKPTPSRTTKPARKTVVTV